jgi:hypothetical protein
MKNRNSDLAEQSIPDKWISWLFGHNVLFIHLSGTIHSMFMMFTVFPSLLVKRLSPRNARMCCGLGRPVASIRRDCWHFSKFSMVVYAWQGDLAHTAMVLYKIKIMSMSLNRDQFCSHKCLNELGILFSLENYCFCCFSKNRNWLCISFPLSTWVFCLEPMLVIFTFAF